MPSLRHLRAQVARGAPDLVVRLLLLAALLGVLAAVGCLYMSSKVDYEKGTDFSAYQTFSVERAQALDAGGQAAQLAGAEWVDRRTKDRIRLRLEKKGSGMEVRLSLKSHGLLGGPFESEWTD